MRQVLTYLRFSSKPQERGDSIRRQTELFERWLKANPDAEVIDQFKDEGQSAFHGKHLKGDFGRMLQNIEDGKYPAGQTVLLVESEDRLNRQKARKTESLVDLITGKGIDVICLASGKVYNSENIDELGTSIQLKIAAHIAYQQSKDKSKKVSEAWGERAKLALEGKQPLTKNVPGWIDPDTRQLNEHAQTVKDIFRLLLDGESLHQISRHLQASNTKSFSRRKDANGFSVHSVRTILRSESTIGTLAASNHNDRPAIPDYYEAAVDIGTFNKAQEILSKNRIGRTPASENPITINLFKGLMRCQCGASVHPTGVKNTYQGVYRCNNVADGRCKVPTLKRKAFDSWMIENIVGMLEQSDDNDTEREKAELQYKIEMLSKRIARGSALLIDLDDVTELKEEVKKLNHQRKEYQSKLETLSQRESLSDKSLPYLAEIDLSSKPGRVEAQLILSKYVQAITIQLDMIVIKLHNGCVIGQPRNLQPVLSRQLIEAVVKLKDGKNIDAFDIISNDENFQKSGKTLLKRT
ncbi:recombinase family protein [Citrobacter portucalensis]|uniref:recombinase family protein n=1 Tax=Citrobacter portucalensis TaxID=1639133 RepID=UPI00226AFEBB|nr:recombinase family protein [Citrobacter portucalensis]MCX8984459.1 recombinase family protein [Citrobacter portucalensis]